MCRCPFPNCAVDWEPVTMPESVPFDKETKNQEEALECCYEVWRAGNEWEKVQDYYTKWNDTYDKVNYDKIRNNIDCDPVQYCYTCTVDG